MALTKKPYGGSKIRKAHMVQGNASVLWFVRLRQGLRTTWLSLSLSNLWITHLTLYDSSAAQQCPTANIPLG